MYLVVRSIIYSTRVICLRGLVTRKNIGPQCIDNMIGPEAAKFPKLVTKSIAIRSYAITIVEILEAVIY